MAVTNKGTGKPVTSLVAPVIIRVGLIIAAFALICIGGILGSTHTVSTLTQDLAPAQDANADFLQDLTQMDSQVNAWARSGDVRARQQYREALERLPGLEKEVGEYADRDTHLDLLVDNQIKAAEAWITGYADPRIAAPGGENTFNPQTYELGRGLLAEFVQEHAATEKEFRARSDQAEKDANLRFRLTIIAVVVIAALAWVFVGRSRDMLLRELSEPLLALEGSVTKMARNDPDARADVRGPKEVRAVAVAFNDFADAQSRARAVEGRIQTELRVLDTAKDDFVSNVSHELRTPLTTISGYLEILSEEFEGKLEPRHERMLEATRRNVSRLKVLIDDLLALSKAENRATDLEASDIVSLVRDAVTDVRITGARRGVRVEITAPNTPIMVLSDRPMLHRAFLNVLANAVKFSHDDGVVSVEVARRLGQAEIAVIDRGIGIPKSEIDRLGSRFFRASNAVSNEIAGTGLGLRIVQTIVDKHAGEMKIESVEGEGTTLTIRLRVREELPRTPSEHIGNSSTRS